MVVSSRCDHTLFLVIMRNNCVRQTGSGIDFYHCSYGKIRLTTNISEIVRDTMLEVKWDTNHGFSIGTMNFDSG